MAVNKKEKFVTAECERPHSLLTLDENIPNESACIGATRGLH